MFGKNQNMTKIITIYSEMNSEICIVVNILNGQKMTFFVPLVTDYSFGGANCGERTSKWRIGGPALLKTGE